MTWKLFTSAPLAMTCLLAAADLGAPALADGMAPRARAAAAAPAPAKEARRCTLSANAALASEYIFRGFSQTSEGLAVQAGFDVTCGNFYIGVWGSNLDWGPAYQPGPDNFVTWASMELDSYAGLKGKFDRFSYDIGVIYYAYPNSTRNSFLVADFDYDRVRNDYLEIKAGVGVDLWKNATLGVTGFYSPDYQYQTGQVWTIETGFVQAFAAYWGITPTFSALYGYQIGNNYAYAARITGGEAEYAYWNAGVTLGFLEKWSLDLRYWDTDLGRNGFCTGPYFQCDERFVAILKFTY